MVYRGRYCRLLVFLTTCPDFVSCKHPTRALNFSSWVAYGTSEIQGHSQVCCGRHRGPNAPSKTIDANLDFVVL